MKTRPIKPAKQLKPKINYIDNKEFYEAMKRFKILCKEAETKHQEQVELFKAGVLPVEPKLVYPRVSNYIGECIYKIANKLNNSPNFCRYSYRDEMVADGIEDCLKNIRSFDPEKSSNPFSYFTQTCFYAAVRRIKKEKKQKDIKSALIQNSAAYEYFSNSQNVHDDSHHENKYLEFLFENMDIIQTPAEKEQSAKKVVKRTTKAYQKKMQELKEKEDELVRSLNGEAPTSDDEGADKSEIYSRHKTVLDLHEDTDFMEALWKEAEESGEY